MKIVTSPSKRGLCWEYVADTFDLAHVPKFMFTYEQARNEASIRNDTEKRK